MLELLKDAKQEIERQEDSNCRLREEVESLQIELMREILLSGTELQLARTMIDNLNADNIGLRSEKASLEVRMC